MQCVLIWFSEKLANAGLGESAVQSSKLHNNASLAMDGRLDTCSITNDTNAEGVKGQWYEN